MIVSANSMLGGHLKLDPGEMYALNVRFVSKGNATFGARVFNLDILQLDSKDVIGGVRFALRTHARICTRVRILPRTTFRVHETEATGSGSL